MTGLFNWLDPLEAKRRQELRYQSAEVFLRTGYRVCFDSSQCGSGFACVGGSCVLIKDSTSNAGNCSGTSSTSEGGNCTSGGDTGCTTAGCSNDADCPCGRCCRYDAYGTVNCYCGQCPKYDGEACTADSQCFSGVCRNGICGEGYCTIFCDQYYKSTGTRFAGCEGGTCDECSSCQGNNQCAKNTYGPCWCTGCKSDEQCNKNTAQCEPATQIGYCKDKRICGSPTGEKCCKSYAGWANNPNTCPDGTLVDTPCPESPSECTDNITYVPGYLPEWSPPCKSGCTCTVTGSIATDTLTAYLWRECCDTPACDCVKNPETCDAQCGSCKKCISGQCATVANCPPTTLQSNDTDTCFVGYFGYGCFKYVTVYDNDTCYFGPLQPDGGFSGVYIGGGTIRVTSCSGNYCPLYPVGSTTGIPRSPIAINNATGTLGSSDFCNNAGNAVGTTYS